MYKYLAIAFGFILLVFCCPDYTLCDTALDYNGTFYVYTYQNYTSATAETIKNGNGYIISCDTKFAKKLHSALNKNLIAGYSFSFKGSNQDIDNFINKYDCQILFNENVEQIKFCYAFSPYFEEFVTYKEQKINIQISSNEDTISIGVPLILGSA